MLCYISNGGWLNSVSVRKKSELRDCELCTCIRERERFTAINLTLYIPIEKYKFEVRVTYVHVCELFLQ